MKNLQAMKETVILLTSMLLLLGCRGKNPPTGNKPPERANYESQKDYEKALKTYKKNRKRKMRR